ncbi:MAG: hypothetical protein WB869_08140 [Candidatus Acidiferrales bacterium]
MVDKTVEEDRSDWRLPLYALLGTLIVFLPLAISPPSSLLYIFVVVPIIGILLSVYAVKDAIAKNRRRCLSILSMLAIH